MPAKDIFFFRNKIIKAHNNIACFPDIFWSLDGRIDLLRSKQFYQDMGKPNNQEIFSN